MQSRRKWKLRYYRERKRRKESEKAIEQLYSDYNDAGNKMFEYAEQVEQLETKEQKLIEKLEIDIEKANEIINDQDYKYIDEIINEQYERRDYAQEILKELKGEKE